MTTSPKQSLIKVLVPIFGALLALAVATAVFINTGRSTSSTKPPATSPAQAPSTAATKPSATPPAAQPTPSASAQPATPTESQAGPQAAPPVAQTTVQPPAQPATTAATPTTEHFRPLQLDTSPTLDTLGSLDPASGQSMQITFSPVGAGIAALDLTGYYDTIRRTDHIRVQETHVFPWVDASGQQWEPTQVPFALTAVEINGVSVDVSGLVTQAGQPPRRIPLWKQVGPGSFECTIVNDQNQPVLKLSRTFTIQPGSYVIAIRQSATNLSSQPLVVRFSQFASVDPPKTKASYGGDKRRVRFGYQFPANLQGTDPTVLSKEYLWYRTSGEVMGRRNPAGIYEPTLELWPNTLSTRREHRLVWAGQSDQYFGVAAFPASVQGTDKAWTLIERVHRLLLKPGADPARDFSATMALFLTTAPRSIAPGQTGDFSMNAYAGPLDPKLLAADPVARDAGIPGLLVYNLGGMCGPCTFQWLTGPLIGLLRAIHDYLVFDWALAIMVLVLIVRGLLHPVTRWSQIRIQRFGKQMSDMAPKQKKLQEKYASDPQKMREEMAKLWREEGVNPAGMLGCLPMFLQTPVWIALFATLSFAIELRHQPAFFGLFQMLSGGSWSFLADLSEPDHFIWLPGSMHFHVPLLGDMIGTITGINILPIILGVVFWIQQKYMTPPTSAPLTPEQEMQQKMIKYMMVFMFPVMMYNAPSGLALYFITNSTLGILESRWIRKHIEKHKLLEVKKPASGGKPSFMERLQQIAEERQRQMGKVKGMPPPAKRRKP